MTTETDTPIPAEPEDTAAKVDKVIETLEPRVEKREQRVYFKDENGNEFERVYFQQKLAWFNKLELTSVVGKGMDHIMENNQDGGIMEMLADGSTSMDSFLRILFQISGVAPDLLMEMYMIALGVPRHERPIVEDIWRLPHNEEDGSGGLSDEDGYEIAVLIFRQNGQALRDFFVNKVKNLIEEAQKAFADPDAESKAKQD
jgi:hypothetical protein